MGSQAPFVRLSAAFNKTSNSLWNRIRSAIKQTCQFTCVKIKYFLFLALQQNRRTGFVSLQRNV